MNIIGHRGARGLAPENTISSLKKARQHHVDEVEFDVRVTEDNVPILHHDKDIVDMSGVKMNILKTDYKRLKVHKPDLATLEEALVALGKRPKANVEVKPRVDIAPIVKVIKKYQKLGYSMKHVFIASKNQTTLIELHAALPEIEKIVIEPWSGVRAVRRARQVNTKRLSMNQLWLWKGFIGPMARHGWQLSAYTLNDRAKADRWASYGLWGVITDYPDRFKG